MRRKSTVRTKQVSKALRRLQALGLGLAALGAAAAAGGGKLWTVELGNLVSTRLSREVLESALGQAVWEDSLDQSSRAVVNASPLLASGMILETDENEEVVDSETLPLETAAETESTDAPQESAASAEETPAETAAAQNPESITPAALEAVELNNKSGAEVDLEAVAALDCTLDLSGEPQILIMHTHGTEAYTPEGEDSYEASDSYRTTDEACNVLRVGEELAGVLREQGFSVVHDTTLYDYPEYTGSYGRAKDGIAEWLEEYPSISMVLDVHRDALIAEDGTARKVSATLDGESAAQVMLVVGTDQGGLTHPNWRTNLSLAIRVQRSLLGIDPDFPRPINLRSARFNQHMTAGSLLVEVGSCGNTLQEALLGVRCFGAALGNVLAEME